MNFNSDMEKMLSGIEEEVKVTRQYIGKEFLHPKVMQAIRAVPRHEFVPKNQQMLAYVNGPLSIGHGQTISQPYIVALMTDLLAVNEDSTVLEIGTGSGYQSAVLASLVKQVYTMEIIPELLSQARQRFDKLGYKNIEVRLDDGHNGWLDHAPYDGILVTAAADEIPQSLLEQLKPNARLVIPVGPAYGSQDLLLVRKRQNGEIQIENILAVAFVPLVSPGKLDSR